MFLYLTTRGRTSGLPRRVELWFVSHAKRYYVVAETRWQAGWVKNLVQTPEVSISVGTPEQPELHLARRAAHARVVEREREAKLAAEVAALMEAKYEWSDGLIVELAPETGERDRGGHGRE